MRKLIILRGAIRKKQTKSFIPHITGNRGFINQKNHV